jgi:hypothetical protein
MQLQFAVTHGILFCCKQIPPLLFSLESILKRAVSISIGSSSRNKSVQIQLLGETVQIERIGTDGDLQKAAELYRELDGKVDAFGVGGTDLGFAVNGKFFLLHSIQSMVEPVQKTPLVDGNGLKILLESQAAQFLENNLKGLNHKKPAKSLLVSGVDRWGLATSFDKAGYQCVYGDLMFALGIGIPIRSIAAMKVLASILIPVVSRLPFHWIYPTGESQETRKPKWEKYFDWADVIAGDCHYIHRYMPDSMPGKIIVSNTTTENDRKFFQQAGIFALMTTTPILEGRSFGTNMMEAALVAVTGWNGPISYARGSDYLLHLNKTIDTIQMQPQFQILNPL